MEIGENPFTSDTFTRIWTAHFNKSEEGFAFPFIENLRFKKHPFFNLYSNIGGTHTKGIDYELADTETNSLGNKALLICDVPGYFDQPFPRDKQPGVYSVKQYPGYLIDLKGVNSLKDYMQEAFSKSSRYKLRKYKKRLEQSFEVRYQMFTGDIEERTYTDLFSQFRTLLGMRFDQKQTTNNNLDEEEWRFYQEVALAMMREGKAGLFVVFAGDYPVAITLNYFSDTVVFDAITVFNIKFSKFHPGSVSIMGLIDWCIENQMDILDFSKGHFDYKERWATRRYDFHFHIFYNPKSATSRITAWLLSRYLKVKQSLREYRVNEKLHAVKYKIRRAPGTPNPKGLSYEMRDENDEEATGLPVGKGTSQFNLLLEAIAEALYLTGDHIDQVGLYRDPENPHRFLLKGPKTHKSILLKQPLPTLNDSPQEKGLN